MTRCELRKYLGITRFSDRLIGESCEESQQCPDSDPWSSGTNQLCQNGACACVANAAVETGSIGKYN